MTKITKSSALTLWKMGERFIMCPCNCRPDGMLAVKMGGEKEIEHTTKEFVKMINAYEYYNCNAENGGRINFYMD